MKNVKCSITAVIALTLAASVSMAAPVPPPLLGTTARSSTQADKFRRQTACPSTFKFGSPCPGYIIDHVKPLCLDGKDDISNMRWQEKKASLVTDILERRICSDVRRLYVLKSK